MQQARAVDRATAGDGPAILQLLEDCKLPTDGVLDHLDTAFVVRDGARLLACAALEIYADGALLRSVAVARDARGLGLGRDLTSAALRHAESLGLPAIYLLTTTAENYFPKLGFEAIAREDVPESVRESVEFRSACPSSAVVMRRVR